MILLLAGLAQAADPVAVDDTYQTDEDETLITVNAAGVLGNDTDGDNDVLTASLVTDTTDGTLTLNADGGFTFVPNPDFAGTATFTYVANDGTTNSNTGTVTITVTGLNDRPEGEHDSYSVDEDGEFEVKAPGVLDNDSDVDGDSLEVQLLDDVDHGELVLDSDGGFVYTPDPDYFGTDRFTYEASDGAENTSPTQVSLEVVSVNDLPTAEDVSATASGAHTVTVQLKGTDPEDAELTYAIGDPPQHGSAEINGAKLEYTAEFEFEGVDTFTYVVDDGEDQAEATVTITVELAKVDKGCGCSNGSVASGWLGLLVLLGTRRR